MEQICGLALSMPQTFYAARTPELLPHYFSDVKSQNDGLDHMGELLLWAGS